MGALFHNRQIDPHSPSLKASNLLSNESEVSRASFHFIKKIETFGIDEESILWLANYVKNPLQKFYVRQTSKIKVYDHKRVQCVAQELKIMTQSNNHHIIKVYYAFQDYQYLYLVSEPLDSISFEHLLRNHIFKQNETRYVVLALISILEDVHAKGFALTELSPKNIHFDRQSGQLKLVEISNPNRIDSYYSSNAVINLCPYSAPEILYRGRVLAECDFYSIGVIIYEMMTQEKILPLEQPSIKRDRLTILNEEIEVEKSKIPEDWEPESADFLIKILVKNPSLRLGRYGSFEIKNHAWLRAFQSPNYQTSIDLADLDLPSNLLSDQDQQSKLEKGLSKLIKSHCFQGLFEGYYFRPSPDEKERETTEEALTKSEMIFNQSNIKLQQSAF